MKGSSKPRRKTIKEKGSEDLLADFRVKIGPLKLTRFERARIIGARALQLALGAPMFVSVTKGVVDPVGLAIIEVQARVLPISIRRSLPNDMYQDIPVDALL